MLLAIDPGPTESGYVILSGGKLTNFGKLDNETILGMISAMPIYDPDSSLKIENTLAIEMIAHYGIPAGAETFETCFWIGRFYEAWVWVNHKPLLIFRRDVKKELCGTAFKKKDKDVREAIIKIFGGEVRAIGNTKRPGPLHSMVKDAWQALAIGIYASRKLNGKLRSAPKQLELKAEKGP